MYHHVSNSTNKTTDSRDQKNECQSREDMASRNCSSVIVYVKFSKTGDADSNILYALKEDQHW